MGSMFLFSMPTFLSGAAQVFDLGGTFPRYNSSRTPEEADARALLVDLACVGQLIGPPVSLEQSTHVRSQEAQDAAGTGASR